MKHSVKKSNVNEIERYISDFEGKTKEQLLKMREIISACIPEADEVISYGMPAYKINKVLVYYAGYDKHIGFYPTPSAIIAFEKELAGYKTSKGAIQFQLDKALPKTLIAKIVAFRKKEDRELVKKSQ